MDNISLFFIPTTFGLCAYILGSIPFGVLIAKIKGGTNPLQTGSKSIGTTNMARTNGIGAAAITLICDLLKGALPILAAYGVFAFAGITVDLFPITIAFAYFFAVFGHCFSIFLHFKGGKGIATGFGGILVISPMIAGIILLVFIIIFLIFRYVSLASICAVLTFAACGIVFFLLGLLELNITISFVLVSALIIFQHRTNISRLIKGQEPKFSFEKKH
ncbi:MAG: glycerol-3-phosphate 1-O-acyltransferase PlsY [Coriobacteriales bacterium]|nr:glycerol-3-phosphate 1-O-acyltransferase PlsY [Coriobacteriales bacterium]